MATSLSGSTGPPIPEPARAEATGMPFLCGISGHKPSPNLSPFPFSVPTNESLVLGDIAGCATRKTWQIVHLFSNILKPHSAGLDREQGHVDEVWHMLSAAMARCSTTSHYCETIQWTTSEHWLPTETDRVSKEIYSVVPAREQLALCMRRGRKGFSMNVH